MKEILTMRHVAKAILATIGIACIVLAFSIVDGPLTETIPVFLLLSGIGLGAIYMYGKV